MWFLDCYHHGALLGDEFPVNSYGPAAREDVEKLKSRIGTNFQRTEIVLTTKGQNPLPVDFWPGASRPR